MGVAAHIDVLPDEGRLRGLSRRAGLHLGQRRLSNGFALGLPGRNRRRGLRWRVGRGRRPRHGRLSEPQVVPGRTREFERELEVTFAVGRAAGGQLVLGPALFLDTRQEPLRELAGRRAGARRDPVDDLAALTCAHAPPAFGDRAALREDECHRCGRRHGRKRCPFRPRQWRGAGQRLIRRQARRGRQPRRHIKGRELRPGRDHQRATERAGEDDEAVAGSRADAEHGDVPIVGRVVDGLVAEEPDLRLSGCAVVPV